MSISKRV